MPYHKRLTRLPVILIILMSLTVGFITQDKPDTVTAQAAPSTYKANAEFAEVPSQEPYRILLKSRQFTPPADLGEGLTALAAAGGAPRHMLVQLDRIPDDAEKEALAEAGIRLLGYVPNYAWFATVEGTPPYASEVLSMVRWIGAIKAEDKAEPALLAGRIGWWAHSEKDRVRVLVLLFDDQSIDDMSFQIRDVDYRVLAHHKELGLIALDIPLHELPLALRADAIQWVESIPPQGILKNDGARDAVKADVLELDPYNLTGSGVTVLVYDGGSVDWRHGDLLDRVVFTQTTTLNDHATHVAGTIGGNGALSANHLGTERQWQGMAPEVRLVSMDYFGVGDPIWLNPGDLYDEYRAAVNSHGVDVANNSWGDVCSVDGGTTIRDGYQATARTIDRIIHGDGIGRGIPLIWAAGNERKASWGCGTNPNAFANYRTQDPLQEAKNIISVGAINSDDSSMTSFSNWGPVSDGRLKPEIVAPGCERDTARNNGVYTRTIWSTLPGNTYGGMCGTSMAAPVVSGLSALLIEQYRDTYNNAEPWPSAIKALLVQSAHDLDDGTTWYNPGPDYASGYGLVDAKIAVDLVRAKALRQDTIAHGETDSYEIWIPAGAAQLKVTLAWDDPAGAENADPALVNDLDIVLIGPTTTHFPWILDPTHPEADALRGRDGRNNLEQVLVANPMSGKWTIRINGFSVPQGPQRYSIVSEALFDIVEPGRGGQIYAGPASSPQKVVIQTTKPSDGLGANQFQVTVGGQPANILTVYEGSDRYVLEVMPVAVPANGSYDLSVLVPTASVWNVKERAVLFADTANVDAALVIDRSGSMSTANKMNAAKDAAKQFVDLMQVNDMVGVVSFDDIVETNFVLTSIDGQSSVKTGAKGAIDALYSRGMTSIGGGLQRGQEQLSTRGQANHPWAIVLLSDGLENTAPYVSNVLPTIKASKTTVHTVGLGADADEALMLDIASQTGGTYNFAPTPQELAGIYNTIAGAVANRQTLLSAAGVAQQGVTDQKDVVVDSTVSDATFSISWSNSGSTIDLALRKPNGQIVDPTVAANDPNVEYVAGSTYRYYRIIRPTLTAGVWQLRITGGSVATTSEKDATASPASESYTARVSAQTALTARFYLDRNSYLTTEPIKLVVTLSDQQPIRGAMVQVSAQPPSQAAVAIRSSAWIGANGDTIPDPTKVTELNERYTQAATTITLYDDGLHGDGLAQDGVYANTFINTYRAGTWMFSASASGASNGGEAFARYAEISTYIAQNPNPRIRQIYLPLITRNLESVAWRASNLTGRIVYDLTSTPTSCTTLFAATDSGAFRSTDGGASWQSLNVGATEGPAGGTMKFDNLLSPEANLTPAVIACPANPNIVYLTQWGSGVRRSLDGGASWESRNNGLADLWVYDLAVDPNNCNVVYAAGNSQGVFKTSDGGGSWQARNAGLGSLLTRSISVAPNNPNRLYVGTTAGVYRSDNGAMTWTATAALPGAAVWGLGVARDNADLVYVGVYGYGIYESTNGGGTWQMQNQGLSNLKVRALAVDPTASQTIYAGLEDNAGVYRSVDGASNWAEFNNALASRTIKALWLDGGACRRLHAGTTDGAWYIAP